MHVLHGGRRRRTLSQKIDLFLDYGVSLAPLWIFGFCFALIGVAALIRAF